MTLLLPVHEKLEISHRTFGDLYFFLIIFKVLNN